MQRVTFKAPGKNLKKDENVINVVPFAIKHKGVAKVDEFFNHKTQKLSEEKDREILKNSLYGRKLLGKEVKIGEKFIGVVFKKEHEKQMDFQYVATEAFTHFRYWNHDDEPQESDKFNEILAFMSISNDANHEITTL